MAYDRPRPLPDETSPLSSSIPEAPPLPLARSVLDRFRYGARKATPQALLSDPSKDASIISSNFGPASSLSTSHKTGLKLRALDINQTRSHVVLAGVKILKTVRLDDDPSCTEDFNLRTAAVNYAGASPLPHDVPARAPRAFVPDYASAQRDTFDIEDVAWSNNQFRDYVATAARNGKIMLYDMSRPSVEVGSLHEHFRQVHKVDFNPMEGACLLSGSQDGTVRLWDLRNYRKNSMVCTSMNTFPGRSEGVRHVKWSPRDTWSFAFGTDNGVIQRWDTRHNRHPVLKFSAHNQTCNSIDWHPDGKHLVSAGKDQVVKVWNIAHDARGGAVFSLRTPREVQNVRWRPSCFVADSQEQGIKQCTHFATSYRHMPVVHVWDLRRPYLPFREIHHRINTGTTDMLWRSKDLLWTVGPEGEFSQTDVPFAPKSVDRRPFSVVSCAPNGELSFASKKRPSRYWANTDIGLDVSANSRRPSRSPERLPFGRSPGDDSFDERFLGASIRKRHSRAASIKSAKSLGTTPPSTDEMTRMITTDLKITMDAYDIFRPAQPTKTGNLPGTSLSGVFTYLAQKYKKPPMFLKTDLAYLQNIRAVFEQNATYAQRASLYRDSQTWKILGLQVSQALQKRATYNQGDRSGYMPVKKLPPPEPFGSGIPKTASPKALQDGSILEPDGVDAKKATQSFSNVPTPIVRPARALSDEVDRDPDVDVPGNVGLPPSVTSDLLQNPRGSPGNDGNKMAEEVKAHSPQLSREHDAYDLREREAAMSPWESQRRVPYSLEAPSPQSKGVNVPPPLDRRGSSDSFMIFSTSSDSPSRIFPDSSFRSDLSPTIGRESGRENDSARFNSSFHSTDSAQSKLSSRKGSHDSKTGGFMRDLESFQDLPTNGNMLVDDFVEGGRKPNSIGSSGYDISRSSSQELSVNDFVTDESASAGEHSSRSEFLSREDHNELRSSSEKIHTNLSISKPSGTSASVKGGERDVNADAKAEALTKLTQKTPSALGRVDEKSSTKKVAWVTDYIVPIKKDKYEDLSALQADAILRQVLLWYSTRGEAQMAAHIFLLTASLLAPPGTSSMSGPRPETHLSASYQDHLTSSALSMPREAAISILNMFHAPLESLSIPPIFAESVLSAYHEQLLTSNLLNSAADLRRLSYPAFPAVFEQGLKDVEIGTLCLGCDNPINNPTSKMRCESCHQRQAECAICLCLDSPFELPGLKKGSAKTETPPPTANLQEVQGIRPTDTLFSEPDESSLKIQPKLHTTCVLCNHTTHTACSIAWFTDSSSPSTGAGGACPVPGCLCDCVRGYYRNQRLQKLETRERQKQNAAAGVRRDDWNVGESRAVGRVRGALRGVGGPSPGEEAKTAASEGPRVLEQGPRRGGLAEHGRTMSDEAKRVRLVTPDGTES